MKIGFLPLYVKLYDDVDPASRPRFNEFYEKVAVMFEQKGVEVVRSPFCRLANEFEDTVKLFEKENVDAIVTMHMAYSPSLECIDAFCATELPIVVLDTTETYEFDNLQSPSEVMFNHGIHGVMDMCAMLTRRGKEYAIAAGHYAESDVMDRALGFVRAAISAKALSSAKVARVGGPFAGMGDFVVPYKEMKKRFGIEAYDLSAAKLTSCADSITDDEIKAEIALDKQNFDFDENVVEEEYYESTKANLAMRKCIEKEGLTAFTVTFNGLGKEKAGIDYMPFIEICKAMQRGTGYAGEGDTLTAAFTGAFLQGYPKTSFVEIFCPDWKNNLIFLSHMGEMSFAVADTKPYVKRMGTDYVKGIFPYGAYIRMAGGKGVYVNINKDKDDFKLVISENEIVSYEDDNFQGRMRGWMKVDSTAEFLKLHSLHGATHHSMFVFDATAEEIEYFAKLTGLKTVRI